MASISGKFIDTKDCTTIETINNKNYDEYKNNNGLNHLLVWLEILLNCNEAYREFISSEYEFENVKLKEKDFINEKHYCDEIYLENKKFIS